MNRKLRNSADCTLASLPIWSSARLLLVRPGVVVGSPPSPSTPGQTFRSCIPCRNILEEDGRRCFKVKSQRYRLKIFVAAMFKQNSENSPVFAKQSDSGAAHGHSSARPVDIPHWMNLGSCPLKHSEVISGVPKQCQDTNSLLFCPLLHKKITTTTTTLIPSGWHRRRLPQPALWAT
ncbi:hypothetical protein INR49_025468 [Caranx melampygus]|nr:hypothetical protein INR49_025468 [Caranx melampygus]